eukprot:Em0020g1087a
MTEASVNESELFGDSIATSLARDLDTVDIPAADILNVINTRPSLLLGRHVSSRQLARQRSGASVLRTGASITTTDGPSSSWVSPERLASSTLVDERNSIDRLASGAGQREEDAFDLQYIAYGERLAGRRATMTLERRIREQHRTLNRRSIAANNSMWATFASVKWPKLKSKLQVALSYRLWKVHIKQVEGNFGTAVASYFTLLRWLFLVNVGIFTLWFGFVCIPQFIWETTPAVTIKPNYQTTCVFNSSASYNCSNGFPTVLYRVGTNCTLVNANNTVLISMCSVHGGVADGEQCSSGINVTGLKTNCSAEALHVCKDVVPCTQWYDYIVGFITGQGIFNETVLFLGHYTNATTIRNRSYRLPLVTLVMTGVVYAISFVLLVHKMGEAYNESYIEFGANRKINFCNKVFSAWDYNITDETAAVLKRAHIKTDLEEEVADCGKRLLKRTPSQMFVIILLRLFTNSIVLVILSVAGYVIYLAANWSLSQLSKANLFWNGLVVPVVVSALNIVLPFLFDILARFEKFKTRSGEIKMTLLRAILVRVSSLVVLIITDYTLIKCTQPGGTGGQGADKCTLSGLDILGGGSNSTGTASNCRVECWETFIGQDFYKLAWTNCVVTVISTIAFETAMMIIHKLLYTRIKWRYIQPLFTKATFSIPQSILDLIYTQLLLWLGFLFSPLQPVIILLTFILTFYVKKYSLMWNLEPERRGIFKAARTNFLFLLLLLVTLFGALVPVGFAVAKLQPSASCGPFKGYSTAVAVLSDLIASIQQCDARRVIDFLGSAGFVVPVIILLLVIIYAMFIILRSRNAKFELIKTQLILEGANMAHVSTMVTNLVQQKLTTQTLQRAAHTITPTDTQITDIG